MPLLTTPSYSMRFPFSNGHFQTLFPPLFRKVMDVPAERIRMDTQDGDFLDLDFLYGNERQTQYTGGAPAPLVVVSHGLEGHSRRKYVRGMARCLNARGWDVCAWNFRGCSGEPNHVLRMYHSGDTEDLRAVIDFCLTRGYEQIALVGFSMGGNQILKLLGEAPQELPEAIRAAAVFSVPCDLVGAAKVLDQPGNAIYMRYFMRTLREKMRQKKALYPQRLNIDGLDRMRTFREFDNRFTAPMHGFRNAEDYWRKSGSGQFLEHINVPALLVNAGNDPFLSPGCYPEEAARSSAHLFLEMPDTGGHVGFVFKNPEGYYWSELRAAQFLSTYLV